MPWQPAALVYPDAELLTTTYLRVTLAARAESYAAGVLVGIAIPSSRPDRMVVVRRDGGGDGEFRDQARLSLRIFASTEQDANNLAALVLALLRAMPGAVAEVLRVVVQSGPTVIADASGQPMRYVVTEINTRGEQLA